jgi:signal transduction histidine kinase
VVKITLIRVSTMTMSAIGLVCVGLASWLAVANRGVSVDAPVPEPVSVFVWVQMVSAGVWIGAAVILLRRPEIGWSTLCSLAGLSHAAAAVAYGWAVRVFVVGSASVGGDLAVWVTTAALPVEVLALNWMALTIPDGHLPRGRWRLLTVGTVVATVLGLVVAASAQLDVDGTDFGSARHPIGGGLTVPGFLPAVFLAPTALIVLAAVVVRWRRSTGDVRLAMRRILVVSVAGLVIPALLLARPEFAVGTAQVIGALQILTFLAVVLRHQLFGIDSVLERALLYSLLTGLLLGLYAALVAAGDAAFDDSVGPFAAVAVALIALPAHSILSRSVARFMYGDRDQPQRIVASVIRRSSVAAAPGKMLDDVLAEIGSGLALDHLAVTGPDDGQTIAQIGEPRLHEVDRFELIHRGRLVGELHAAPRPGEDALDATDHAVLRDVSNHLASMVDAASSAVALKASRDRLVHVREEERRRLRRDLHDGLGPVLTGIAFTTDAARNSIDRDPDAAKALLGNVRSELSDAIDEIRRLVEDLRPPSLDELGLIGSIRQHAARFPQLQIDVVQDSEMPPLPAAVEVAAYRIATEALTNTARHAHATQATVQLHLNGHLELEISDDGRQAAAWSPGVGLASMQDRAAEIGGSITAGPTANGGRVHAVLPVTP